MMRLTRTHGLPPQSDKILTALRNAGFTPGLPSRWVDYERAKPVPGFQLERCYDIDAAGSFYTVVDHQGAGRKEALPRYFEALRAAGFDVELCSPIYLRDKIVVLVKTRCDANGEAQPSGV